MAKPGPETRLVKKMRDAAKRAYGERIVIVKYHGSAYSEAGVSDLLCCLDGMFVAVEVKSPDTSHGVTLKQEAFLRRIIAAGGVAVVSESVEGFLETLAKIAPPD